MAIWQGIPMLAADMGDLIWVFLFLVITVGGWLANAIKESQQKKKAQSKSSAPPQTSERSRLDELAERRRRQIEELANRRRGIQQSEPTASARSEPGNLTMSERIERERAREQYEQRAQALRQEREAQQRSAQELAQRERERVRAEQERRAAELAKRQAEQQRAREPRPSVRPIAPPPPPTRAPQAPWRATSPHRQKGMRLTSAELRRGVILKEILDPPLALRPPQEF